MGFLKNLFKSGSIEAAEPKIQFGRFSDSYKAAVHYDAWDLALQLYQKGEYMAAYKQFFLYLEDPSGDSVTYQERGGKWHFQLYQGSKLITGIADYQKFTAEAKVAQMQSPHIGVLRKLLEDNFELKYSRYALDKKQNIILTFSSSSLDGSPYKLYYALKELGTIADKIDDILIANHKDLLPINTHHVRDIPRKEKEIKYKLLTTTLQQCEEAVAKTRLDVAKHPGAVSYAYLDTIYKLDYLLKPEGYMMDTARRINDMYFKDTAQTLAEKNRQIAYELAQLKKIPMDAFFKELYEVRSTFGQTTTSSPSRIREFITSELKNMDWYHEEGHYYFSLAIPSYIVGYSLYNYALPVPLRRLLHLFYRIIEYPFFRELGSKKQFVKANKSLSKKNIKKEIRDICANDHDDYVALVPSTGMLNYTDIHAFAKSYLLMIAKLDFTRKDKR